MLPVLATAASATLDRIKASGTIRLAYREAAAPFSFREGDRVCVYGTRVERAD